MTLSTVFIHVALLSFSYLTLVNADIRPEHSLLVMGWLGTHGPRMSDGDESPISEECISETHEFDDINHFLEGLLDHDENDDVQYDDYDYYQDNVSCTQNEASDVLCNWEDFFTADTKHICEQQGGVFHSLMATENCAYDSEDGIGAMNLRAFHRNIFICIGISCELPEIVQKLSRDAMVAYGPTSCTLSYSEDELNEAS